MLHQCVESSATEWGVPVAAIVRHMDTLKGGLGVMHMTKTDVTVATQGGFTLNSMKTPCGNIQAATWVMALRQKIRHTNAQEIQACFAESAHAFHVSGQRMLSRLRYAAYHPNPMSIGVMGIQVGWKPILKAAGFSIRKVRSNPCYGMEAGAFILAFQSEWLTRNADGAYTLRINPQQGASPPSFLVPVIQKYCDMYGVPYDLAVAIINRESGFNAQAISSAGAIGYMQLMPATAAEMGVNPWIPVQNIQGGVKYLSTLLHKFDGNKVLAVAGYNAGGHAVVQWGYKIPPYAQTIAYVPAVLSVYKYLKEKHQNGG